MPRAQAEGISNRPTRKGQRPLVAAAGAAALVGVAGVRAAAVALLVVVVGAAGVGDELRFVVAVGARSRHPSRAAVGAFFC